MKRILLLFFLAAMLTLTAQAQDVTAQEADILGVDTLYDGLDAGAVDVLEGVSPRNSGNFAEKLWHITENALTQLHTPLRSALSTCGIMLAATLLCALCAQMEGPFTMRAVTFGGALCLTAACAGSIQSMIGLAAETLDRIGAFTALLMPVLSAALTASGGITSGSALYASSMLFFDVLVELIRRLLIPLTYAFTAISAAECALGGETLRPVRELIDWVIRSALKGVMYLFTVYLAVTGVVTGSSDAAAVKAAGSAIGAAVPVVGSILSDATETVLAGASIVRNAAGAFGVLAILATGLAPFMQIAAHYLALKVTAAAGGMIEQGPNARLLGNLTSAMGYMLAMTGSCILMALMSCCCFMKAVRL